MDDLISRREAVNALENSRFLGAPYVNTGILIAKRIIEELPTAEPIIIRCKDCKWYGRADKRRFYRGMDCLQSHIDTIAPDKDFCSRAERREA